MLRGEWIGELIERKKVRITERKFQKLMEIFMTVVHGAMRNAAFQGEQNERFLKRETDAGEIVVRE